MVVDTIGHHFDSISELTGITFDPETYYIFSPEILAAGDFADKLSTEAEWNFHFGNFTTR